MLIRTICYKISCLLLKRKMNHIRFLKEKYLVEGKVSGMSRKCPRCGKTYDGYPALSRKDNKTEICPECGTQEALEEFQKYKENKDK